MAAVPRGAQPVTFSGKGAELTEEGRGESSKGQWGRSNNTRSKGQGGRSNTQQGRGPHAARCRGAVAVTAAAGAPAATALHLRGPPPSLSPVPPAAPRASCLAAPPGPTGGGWNRRGGGQVRYRKDEVCYREGSGSAVCGFLAPPPRPRPAGREVAAAAGVMLGRRRNSLQRSAPASLPALLPFLHPLCLMPRLPSPPSSPQRSSPPPPTPCCGPGTGSSRGPPPPRTPQSPPGGRGSARPAPL